jgi:serine/threonine protein kinase
MLTKKYDEKSVLGTADYVAPEQTINSHDVDCRADIYSLGATFYYLLAGHPPFPDGTISQKLISHQTKEPVPIERHRPEIQRELAFVVRRMMAKLPDERYRTPSEVIAALQPFIPRVMEVPPDDEMPVLSPAAREVSSGPVTAATLASLGQDSTVLRAEAAPRGDRAAATSTRRSLSGGQSIPTTVATAAGKKGTAGRLPSGGDGSSGNMSAPYFEPPPMVSPLGSAALPPVPNPVRPVNETARMAEATDRADALPKSATHRQPPLAEPADKERRRLSPVVKIVIESILVFGLCLMLYFIFRGL